MGFHRATLRPPIVDQTYCKRLPANLLRTITAAIVRLDDEIIYNIEDKEHYSVDKIKTLAAIIKELIAIQKLTQPEEAPKEDTNDWGKAKTAVKKVVKSAIKELNGAELKDKTAINGINELSTAAEVGTDLASISIPDALKEKL
jgi:hypothetical protein